MSDEKLAGARAPFRSAQGMLTNYAIDLYEELVHRLVGLWSYPVDGRLICTDTSEHDLGCIRHVDAEYANQFGDRFP